MLFSANRSAPEWIICFLGNPGEQYARTRHNAGWIACSVLEDDRPIHTSRLKFHAFTDIASFGGSRVLFMRPQTYMNLSGDAVQPAAAFYHIPPSNIIVIQDDIALPPGKLRIKRGGSDGGHNGIKSITQRLGTQDYPVIDWVIGKLTDAEYKEIKDAASRAVSAAEEIISHGIDSAMNKFNH